MATGIRVILDESYLSIVALPVGLIHFTAYHANISLHCLGLEVSHCNCHSTLFGRPFLRVLWPLAG